MTTIPLAERVETSSSRFRIKTHIHSTPYNLSHVLVLILSTWSCPPSLPSSLLDLLSCFRLAEISTRDPPPPPTDFNDRDVV